MSEMTRRPKKKAGAKCPLSECGKCWEETWKQEKRFEKSCRVWDDGSGAWERRKFL